MAAALRVRIIALVPFLGGGPRRHRSIAPHDPVRQKGARPSSQCRVVKSGPVATRLPPAARPPVAARPRGREQREQNGQRPEEQPDRGRVVRAQRREAGAAQPQRNRAPHAPAPARRHCHHDAHPEGYPAHAAAHPGQARLFALRHLLCEDLAERVARVLRAQPVPRHIRVRRRRRLVHLAQRFLLRGRLGAPLLPELPVVQLLLGRQQRRAAVRAPLSEPRVVHLALRAAQERLRIRRLLVGLDPAPRRARLLGSEPLRVGHWSLLLPALVRPLQPEEPGEPTRHQATLGGLTRPEAGRARVLAHSRCRAMSSPIVVASGMVSCTARTTCFWASSTLSAKAKCRPEMTACSISLPLYASEICASSARSKRAGSRLRRERWMDQISRRSALAGRSMKKISSKRPLRSSSGGSASMLLAVATTKTGAVFSWSQVSIAPKTRAVTPPSTCPDEAVPASPFSISSTQSTAGATLSATRIALRRFSSELPMKLEKIRPMSSRKSGSAHWLAIALAVRLFPQPCTPRSNSPLGAGRPNLRAGSPKAAARLPSHCLSESTPPTLPRSSSTLTNSSRPLLRITCRFSSSTSRMSCPPSIPSVAIALAKAFSASDKVSPCAALMSCSACSRDRSMVAWLPCRTTRTISRKSWYRSRNPGSGTSRTETSFSSSTGICSTGESRITVV